MRDSSIPVGQRADLPPPESWEMPLGQSLLKSVANQAQHELDATLHRGGDGWRPRTILKLIEHIRWQQRRVHALSEAFLSAASSENLRWLEQMESETLDEF
jgi:hypothetical protein